MEINAGQSSLVCQDLAERVNGTTISAMAVDRRLDDEPGTDEV